MDKAAGVAELVGDLTNGPALRAQSANLQGAASASWRVSVPAFRVPYLVEVRGDLASQTVARKLQHQPICRAFCVGRPQSYSAERVVKLCRVRGGSSCPANGQAIASAPPRTTASHFLFFIFAIELEHDRLDYFRLLVIRSGSSVFCQSVLFQDETHVHQRRHRVWYLGDVWEVGGWKTNFWQCSAANSPTSCLEQFSCSSDWQLAPLLPSVRGAVYVCLSG